MDVLDADLRACREGTLWDDLAVGHEECIGLGTFVDHRLKFIISNSAGDIFEDLWVFTID